MLNVNNNNENLEEPCENGETCLSNTTTNTETVCEAPRYCLYGAYGSNVNEHVMRRRCPGAIFVRTDVLRGYTLAFNVRSSDNSAKANIVESRHSQIPIIVYKIPFNELDHLDCLEGTYTNTYKKISFIPDQNNRLVFNEDNITNDDMVFVYISTTHTDNIIPYSWYVDTIQTALQAHQLPCTHINTTNVTQDPDLERHAFKKASANNDYSNLYQLYSAHSVLVNRSMNLMDYYTIAMLVRFHIIKPKYFSKNEEGKLSCLNNLLTNVENTYDFNLATCSTTDEYINSSHSLIDALKNLAKILDASFIAPGCSYKEFAHTVYAIASVNMYINTFNITGHNTATQCGSVFKNATRTALTNRVYKYFEIFVSHVRNNTSLLHRAEATAAIEGHSAFNRTYNRVMR